MFTLVTPNRNRIEHLHQSLLSWQKSKLISDIVIVDYESTEPIVYSDFASADKLLIVRVTNTDQWRQGHATNIGIDFASSDYIAKFDSDQLIDTDWPLALMDLKDKFYRGDFRRGAVSNGQVIFSKKHWGEIGGYNEWLSGYGFDDTDFYARLRTSGVKESFLPVGIVSEIPHGNAVRATYDATHGYQLSPDNRLGFDQCKNGCIALSHLWRPIYRLKYNFERLSDGRVKVTLPDWPEDFYRLDKVAQLVAALCYLDPLDHQKAHTLVAEALQPLLDRMGGF
jgi:glycosyltransferase involved in cell wall biosynthesis